MGKYRKKPVVVEAFQFAKDPYLPDWWMDALSQNKVITQGIPFDFPTSAEIHTLEGVMTALPGDYIIKGVQGELYPCKSDIFELTYELVEGE